MSKPEVPIVIKRVTGMRGSMNKGFEAAGLGNNFAKQISNVGSSIKVETEGTKRRLFVRGRGWRNI